MKQRKKLDITVAIPLKKETPSCYFMPGAVWGTVLGAVTLVGPSERPHFSVVAVNDTGETVEMILSDRHSSPSLPGYSSFNRLPRCYWPRPNPLARRAAAGPRPLSTQDFLRNQARNLRGALENRDHIGWVLVRKSVEAVARSLDTRARMIEEGRVL